MIPLLLAVGAAVVAVGKAVEEGKRVANGGGKKPSSDDFKRFLGDKK